MSTEIEQVTLAVAAINKVEMGLNALRVSYDGVVFEVTTTKGLDDAKAARAEIREPRYEVERIRKAAKAPILALGKRLDTEAARITAELEKLEEPIHLQIKTEEDRREAEREAKVAAEAARTTEIQRRIEGIRGWPVHASTQGSLLVGQMLVQADAYVIDPAVFEEFTQQASDALMTSRAALSGLLAQRKEHEAEQAKIIAEREELAKLRADAAERERIATLAQAEADAAARAERERLEAIAKAERDAETARQVEANRLEREKQEANRQRNEMALQEIQAIHHQIIIADTGRAPYCKGGDLHSMDWVLAQTEKWPITEDHFGALFAMAEKTKESTLASLRRKRADLVESMERAARQAELDAQGEAQRRALADETASIAGQRAALEKEQEAIRKAAEPKPKPHRAPTGAELTEVVAKHYGVETKIAVAWLTKINWKKATAA